jgi:hypothetical protein
MITKVSTAAVFAAALALIGCGGSSSAPAQTSATVGAAGATLTVGKATLSIPAGALASATQVTLREAEPRHAGRAHRVEVQFETEPNHASQLSVVVDDKNVKSIKMHDNDADDSSLGQVEVEDRNHHEFKTEVNHSGGIEVEVEHGQACTTACAATEECDDGVCKAHQEDAQAKVCDPVCASGEECDDGVCKPHAEAEHQAPGVPATCTPACATGLECDNGICKVHGKP